ncbi:hypothetical protein niasHT_029101 [Heterodera trifolii]|uniref:Uncharacterized protein n=1 Tax=Heterodera trifolii TaxID=157864 RepID=A0ABD2KN29_9BILA
MDEHHQQQKRAILEALFECCRKRTSWITFELHAANDQNAQIFLVALTEFLSPYAEIDQDKAEVSPEELRAAFFRCGGVSAHSWRLLVLAAEGDNETTKFIGKLLDFLTAEGTSAPRTNCPPAAAPPNSQLANSPLQKQAGTSQASQFPFTAAIHSQSGLTCRQEVVGGIAGQKTPPEHIYDTISSSSSADDSHSPHKKLSTPPGHIYHTVISTTSSGSQRPSVIYDLPPLSSTNSRESVSTTPPPVPQHTHKNRKKNDETPSPASKCSDTKKRKETPKKDNDGKK